MQGEETANPAKANLLQSKTDPPQSKVLNVLKLNHPNEEKSESLRGPIILDGRSK